MTQKELDELQNNYMKDMIASVKELFKSELKSHKEEIKKDREADLKEMGAIKEELGLVKADLKEYGEATALYRALYKNRKTVLAVLSLIVTVSITFWKYIEPLSSNIDK